MDASSGKGFKWLLVGRPRPGLLLQLGGYSPRYRYAADYDLWRAQFGQSGELISADGNGDGVVDNADYVIWRKGQSAAPAPGNSSAVPEPATIAMAVIAASPFWAGRFVVPWFARPAQCDNPE